MQAVLLIGLAVFTAIGAGQGAQASGSEQGAEAYAAACADCHRRPGRLARNFASSDGRAALDTFLSTHHAEDDATRAVIIEYLLGQ